MRALSSHNDFSPFVDRLPNSKDLLHTAMVAHFTLPLRSTISPHARNGIPSPPPPRRSSRNPPDAKKGILWLRDMTETSISARKAREIFDCQIRLVAPTIVGSVCDMPSEAPIPPGYNWRRFSTTPFIAPQNQLSELNPQNYEDAQGRAGAISHGDHHMT
ncbi:hypothetical protein F5882DRAFT_473994 [Hyaloscypha sp. PMI_1271]|nr:hypothetical protein F5882DRAFT_473994 [Hyaloscypha sp. PMI_1271]